MDAAYVFVRVLESAHARARVYVYVRISNYDHPKTKARTHDKFANAFAGPRAGAAHGALPAALIREERFATKEERMKRINSLRFVRLPSVCSPRLEVDLRLSPSLPLGVASTPKRLS
ncbi:hypothetical protein EVAR_85450_1 [Eumeta japonica]|uniref:Uncharacterized protein n=1 Tax=Eumeta variegata TaxID=151549 RepID=A0A4C1WM94_EUMVA|nr:hypothetical protein EVAR_85450_1 [Eumeta japonica]